MPFTHNILSSGHHQMLSSMRMPLRKLNVIFFKRHVTTRSLKGTRNYFLSGTRQTQHIAEKIMQLFSMVSQRRGQEMVPKLKKFYWECLLPEILNSRKA
ncbi:hypothetical protein PR048_005358 [Dryococelus australis]|uniref:Uncharacterized protein n=1 Tax=Dryococelus australis TaxID=614101 RepID=A0ABQ9I8H7_9NEOP|nr:hypothetical protein PR048_005358 [Dryococelus australis]